MAENQARVVAAFDFDGTICAKDSMWIFLRYSFGNMQVAKALFFAAPWIIASFLRIIDNGRAKEKLVGILFKGGQKQQFDTIGAKFAEFIHHSNLLYVDALERITWHKQQNHEVVLISASLSIWLVPIAKKLQVNCICTEMEVYQRKFTGKFSTKNCKGKEKVNRLLKLFPDREVYQLYAYGDSNGDKELLRFADHSFYRLFNQLNKN